MRRLSIRLAAFCAVALLVWQFRGVVSNERVRPFVFDRSHVESVHGATVAFSGDRVLLKMPSGEWDCGLRINPPEGTSFDLSDARCFAVDVENLSTSRQMRLTLHLSSGGQASDSEDHATALLARNRSINTGIALNPGEKGTMAIPLPHPEIYLAPTNALGPYVIDTRRIKGIEFKLQWPFEQEFEGLVDGRLGNFRLIGTPDAARRIPADRYHPFVDEYGQFVHSVWPEKVHSDAELAEDLARECAGLKPAPATWDRYGGWADGPTLEATGHFRTAKHGGKWYLVTPDGHLFFSVGIDVVRNSTDTSNGFDHPDWYAHPIPEDGRMDFAHWNLQKKFGMQDYLPEYHNLVLRRLDAWGINTIGNWSADALMAMGRKPYTLSLADNDPSLPHVPGLKFYDCFDPEFETKLDAMLERRITGAPALSASVSDPMCIGYFIDNELEFGKMTAKMLAADQAECHAKRVFLDFAKGRYKTLDDLNAAWGTAFADWAEAARPMRLPGGNGFRQDGRAFEGLWLARYFGACRKSLQKLAPGKLYLGPRFVGFRQSALLWNTAAKYCDVVTVNTYANSIFNIPESIFDGGVEKPILIGEFHFGALDRGMFKAGLCPVGSQAERARSFTRFVQGALCHPWIVGCHWFQYRDQPLVGRGDGESYQIGFVDVCDRPYPELTAASREVGENLYRYRMNGQPVNSMR